MENRQDDRLLTVEQVQERLPLHRSTIYELLESGKLRSVRIGRRRLISASALQEYIAGLQAQPPPPAQSA
jgi:excisionase family DNA binding protein